MRGLVYAMFSVRVLFSMTSSPSRNNAFFRHSLFSCITPSLSKKKKEREGHFVTFFISLSFFFVLRENGGETHHEDEITTSKKKAAASAFLKKTMEAQITTTTDSEGNENRPRRIVTDHPDIFYTHVVPKLNGNDVKFFYDVNSESRAAIQKSSNARLPDAFEIGDFHTKSTLSGL